MLVLAVDINQQLAQGFQVAEGAGRTVDIAAGAPFGGDYPTQDAGTIATKVALGQPGFGFGNVCQVKGGQDIGLVRARTHNAAVGAVTQGEAQSVKRVSQRLNEIMTYGVNSGMILANPLSGIRAVFKKPKKENMAALPPDELPELMMEIANASIKRTTRCLIEWQLHTMTRPAEAATTRWADIDFDKLIWTIPPERMKKRRPHTIPLTEHALWLLETLKPHSGHREYVFPSDRNPRTHANSQTANMALKRMGFQDRLVSHGLRSMASTILNEHGWDPELIEVALAHVDKDEVRSAYNRTDYIERRRPMMAWWSEHIQKAATGSLSASAINQTRDRNVVPIR